MAIVEEGQLRGSFRGFRNRDTLFEFRNGRRWQQAEYKYCYHYAYMPYARVTEGPGGFELLVDGMSDSVRVKRAR
jgi:hypothetical protein